MERLEITPEDAFDLLRRSSQNLNLKLRDVALEASPKPASWGQEPPATPTKQSGRSPFPKFDAEHDRRFRVRRTRYACEGLSLAAGRPGLSQLVREGATTLSRRSSRTESPASPATHYERVPALLANDG